MIMSSTLGTEDYFVAQLSQQNPTKELNELKSFTKERKDAFLDFDEVRFQFLTEYHSFVSN